MRDTIETPHNGGVLFSFAVGGPARRPRPAMWGQYAPRPPTHMNKLIIGLADKTNALRTKQGFLLIDDGPIADAVLKRSRAKLFDPHTHSFNPLPMTYRKAREFASIVFGSEGKETLTVRSGKRALTRMLLQASILRADSTKEPGILPARSWAVEVIKHYSQVPMSKDVQKALLESTVNFSEWGRRGRASRNVTLKPSPVASVIQRPVAAHHVALFVRPHRERSAATIQLATTRRRRGLAAATGAA